MTQVSVGDAASWIASSTQVAGFDSIEAAFVGLNPPDGEIVELVRTTVTQKVYALRLQTSTQYLILNFSTLEEAQAALTNKPS